MGKCTHWTIRYVNHVKKKRAVFDSSLLRCRKVIKKFDIYWLMGKNVIQYKKFLFFAL